MDGLSWGKYVQSPSAYLSNLDRVISSANANGVYLILEFANGWNSMPSDVQSSVSSNSWGPYFFADSTYQGSDPSLQGQGIWQAWFNGFVSPVVKHIDSQPCVLGYKFLNEPGGVSNGQLASFYGAIGNLIRNISHKYLVYTGPGSHPGDVGLINDIVAISPNFRPAIYDVHYPLTDSGAWAGDAQQASNNNVVMWNGEDSDSFFQSTSNMNLLISYHSASTAYRWDEDGNFLAQSPNPDGNPTPMGTLTSTATDVSNLETQILGAALFFG